MKPLIRNFLFVIRRFKMAVALNILGLSVAFAAFMVIMSQLHYDFGFDKCHKDYDKIFRMEILVPQISTGKVPIVSRPLVDIFVGASPQIVACALIHGFEFDAFFHVENEGGDGERIFFKERATSVTPEYTDVFTFDFVEGDEDALRMPENILIPLSLSQKLFGNESAIGRQFVYDSESKTVGAVYRDFPDNTIVKNCIFSSIPETLDRENWNNWLYNVFIRVNDASNAPLILENIERSFDLEQVFGPGCGVFLTALTDIHFTHDMPYDFSPKANKQTLLILFAIAIVIIVIAAINFTNFSTALTPMRVKNINTQRVLGARRSTLRSAIASEAVVISFLSYFVAILFVTLFSATPLARLVDADLSLTAQPLIIGGTAWVALLAGAFAGAYPAHYMTSFAPALVLKGSFGLSPKGKKIRNTLIGIQFIASFTLIIGASFMYLQNRFMQNSSLGYEKDAMVVVNISQIQKNRDVFTDKVKAFAGIEDVTYGNFLLSSLDSYAKEGVFYRGELCMYQFFPVHHTFLDAMGIAITEGRGFRQDDANKEQGVYVFNEAARKDFNLELNTVFEDLDQTGLGSGEIIGFISDVKYASFRTAVEPMAFYVSGNESIITSYYAYIKLNKNVRVHAALTHIHSTLSEFDPDYPFEVRFFDEVLQRLYEKETALSTLISLFSMLAIFISIVGVFGLVVFDSECRRKEIGIRKVLGATTIGIVIMFNKAYFKILLICFVIAAPLAWYTVTRWLENFAYKTPMYWWVYLLAFVAVAIITAATVTFQNWRVANDNPLKAIKSE